MEEVPPAKPKPGAPMVSPEPKMRPKLRMLSALLPVRVKAYRFSACSQR